MSQNDKPEKLTTRQLRAINLLLRESAIDAVAVQVGVSQRTIYRWLEDPTFYSTLLDAEWRLIDEGIRVAVTDLSDGMKVFSDVMRAEDASYGVRVRAAQALVDSVVKMHSHRMINRLQRIQANNTGDDWIAAEDGGHGQQDSDDDDDSTPDTQP